MAAPTEAELSGEWVHSHEEDGRDGQVFRPAGYGFPPARGRAELDLRADGTYVERSPGPVDVPVASTGTWELHDGNLTLRASGGEPDRTWHVAGVDAQRLLLAK